MSAPDSSAFREALHEDAEGVREFFNRWHLYKKVVSYNYLHHREAYAALAGALDKIAAPFRFMDLGAGDAAWTSQVLQGRPVVRYEAVDLSPVALELARQNLGKLDCEKVLTQGDFSEVIRQGTSQSDMIFIGLSLHHLPRADKEAFLPEIRRRLTSNGSFVFYEPINAPGESRDDVLKRWWQVVLRSWTELTPEERDAVQDHVFNNDYPESCEDYAVMASQAGFAGSEVLYRDSEDLYALIEFRA